MFALGALQVAAGVGVMVLLNHGSAGGPATRVSQGADTAARAAALDRSLQAIEDGERDSPRDRWDPDYVLALVGTDPERLFAWVRDSTSWIPYHGEMRGPVGVLMDRRGNSLDRAVLLATLLDKAGQTVRLAHGELSQELAIRTLPHLICAAGADDPVGFSAESSSHGGLVAAATRYGMDDSSFEETLVSQIQAIDRLSKEIHSRTQDEAQRLLQALGNPSPRTALAKNFDATMSSLRDHWWVQMQSPDGAWRDLDAMSAAMGKPMPVISATETMSLAELIDAPTMHHEVSVRVVAERWSERGLSQYTVLEHALRPADTIGQPIVLQFWPTQWMGGSMPENNPADKPSSDWRAEILEQHDWAAALMVGDDPVAVGALADSGDGSAGSSSGGPMGGLASAFSDTMSGRRTASGSSNSGTALSAVWLDYEIRVPGEPARIIRRTVFDLIGPAGRSAGLTPILDLTNAKRLERGLSLIMQTDILPQVCAIPPQFVAHLMAQTVLAHRQVFVRAIRGDTAQDAQPPVAAAANEGRPLSSLYALALARMQWSLGQGQLFIDRPNLLTSHRYWVAKDDGLVLRHASDIVANEVGVSFADENPFAARLAQGVLDTNVEQLAVTGDRMLGGAGQAFAAQGEWVAIAAAGVGTALPRIELPADTRRRIIADVDAGYAVVAPKMPVPMPNEPFIGWWRVDASTGDTLGFGAGGWGQVTAEESLQNSRSQATANVFRNSFAAKFAHSFGTAYGWCLVPMTVKMLDTDGLHLGSLVATLVASKSECLGDAIFLGLVGAVTMPLIAITMEASETIVAAETKVTAPPEPQLSGKATTYAGPAKPCASPRAETLPAMQAAESTADTVPAGSPATELPPTKTGPTPKWPTSESMYEGGPGRRVYKPAFVETAIEDWAEYQTQASQRYNEAINSRDAAESAMVDISVQINTLEAKGGDAFGGGLYGKRIEIARQLERAQVDVKQTAPELSKANKYVDHWREMQAANQRVIDAVNARDAALQKLDANVCSKADSVDYNGPEWQNYAQAEQSLRNAKNNWSNVDHGGTNAPAAVDPNAATAPGSQAPGGASPPVQSGKTQPLPGAGHGGNPAASPSAKSVAGMLSTQNLLGSK